MGSTLWRRIAGAATGIRDQDAHDVPSILACFADDAVVRDEGEDLRGKESIKAWIGKTIEKYQFQFVPQSIRNDDAEVIVAIEVSGTFDGSPVTLDYHFTIGSDQILSLAVQ
ncbi:MAG: nuclear transport factor 2 family protein [Chthoniobacter sp.]